MSGPVLRLAGPEDDRLIRGLLAAAYADNPKSDAAIIRWQYWDNPFGTTRAWIWERDGQAVAHWAAVPVPLVLDGVAVLGVKTADAATHPDHRRQGLFGTLALRYMQDLRHVGVPAVLTHPNPDSTPGVEASGAVLVERVPAFVRAVDAAWLAERFKLPRPVATALRSAVFGRAATAEGGVGDSTPEDLDALWDGVGERWGVRRDADWWHWRYTLRPGVNYRYVEVRRGGRLVAAAALRLREAFGGRFAYVMEFLAVDDEAARALAATLSEYATQERVAGLVLIATSWSRAASQARAAGFRRLPRPLEPNPLRFLVAAPGGNSQELARRPWSAAWGDLDHL